MIRRTIAFVAVLALAGCQTGPGETEESKEAFKARMMEIEKRMRDSMPKTQEIALKQKLDPKIVEKAQRELGVLKEYLDPPTGKIDFITVNSIQAFQRHMELAEDGLLDEKTLELLEREAKSVEQGNRQYFDTGYYAKRPDA
jgi:hypothetical protein